MERLHIFNPEHDLALACNQWQYTPPKAAMQLCHDLNWIPAIWADSGDYVVVDDISAATASRSLLQALLPVDLPAVHFITPQSSEFKTLTSFEKIPCQGGELARLHHQILPWGWDRPVISRLLGPQIAEARFVPEAGAADEGQLLFNERWIRILSSRQYWRVLLQDHVDEVNTPEELRSSIERHGGRAVLKTPWSSSGRGVHFVDLSRSPSVPGMPYPCLVEPCFHKVKDFAMEFEATAEGTVRYLGLNLFQTRGSSYVGNLLADEKDKEQLLMRGTVGLSLRSCRRKVEEIVAGNIRGRYTGPFGVDFMLVRDDSSGCCEDSIHVCELNLRRTMGHVALVLSRYVHGSMKVVFDGHHYQLRIESGTNFKTTNL